MANNRTIDIKLTQSVDSASVSRSAEQVRKAAEQTAKNITATEQEEANKRVAIAQEEAEAKRRAMESIPRQSSRGGSGGYRPGYETVSAALARQKADRQATEGLLEQMQRLKEAAGGDMSFIDEWTQRLGEQSEMTEAATLATGKLTTAFEPLAYEYGKLSARGTDLRDRLGRVSEAADILSAGLRDGSISREIAERELGKLARISTDCSDETEALGQQMEDLGGIMTSTRERAEGYAAASDSAAKKSAGLGKAATTATGGMVKGFRAAGKAVTFVTHALGRITFAMAAINMAWEGLSKLWDWMQGKSTAATKAAEEHAEAVQALREQEQEYLNRVRGTSNKVLAEKTWEWQERGINAVNKALREELELQQRKFDLELKWKELQLDGEELELSRRERRLAEQEASGLISEEEVASERTAIAREKEELRYRRESEQYASRRLVLEAAGKEAAAGINTAAAGLDKLSPLLEATDPFSDITRSVASQAQMQHRRRRMQVPGEVSDQEAADYAMSNSYVRALLQEAGLGGLYESYTQGLIDLPTELQKHKEKLAKELEAFTTAARKNAADLEELDIGKLRSEVRHTNAQEEIETAATLKNEERQRKEREDALAREVTAAEARAEHAEQAAREAGKSLRQKNKLAIDSRLQEHEGEKGIAALYGKISTSADASMLRKVIAELGSDGRQVSRGGWSGEQLRMYNADNVKEMTALRGRDREFWQKQFQGLLQSMRLENKAEKLDEASDKMKEAAREHRQSLHKIGEGVDAMAAAYAESVEYIKRLEESVNRSLHQTRYARNTGR